MQDDDVSLNRGVAEVRVGKASVTSLGESVIRGGGSFLRDRVSVTRRKVSMLRGEQA